MDASSAEEPPTSESQAPVEATESAANVAEPSRIRAEPVPAPEVDPNEKEDDVRRIARETVAEDLKSWQERYAKAADEGAAGMEERVEEISKRMVRRNAKTVGKGLLEDLRASVVSELMTLRRHILSIVGAVNKGSATTEEGYEQIAAVVRRAGMAIKGKAQDIRTWHENYESEMQAAVTEAAGDHLGSSMVLEILPYRR